MVHGAGTPTENAAELQAAYDEAKTKVTPQYKGLWTSENDILGYVAGDVVFFNGNYWLQNGDTINAGQDPENDSVNSWSLTTINKITIIVAPGIYTFGTTKFAVNAEGIDIVSLTGNPDVMLDGINVTASDIFLKGLNAGENAFELAIGLHLIRIDNCVGGANSFGSSFSGTIKHSKGGVNSFGSSGGMDGFIYYCTFGDTGPLVTGNGHIAWCINADGSAATNQ